MTILPLICSLAMQLLVGIMANIIISVAAVMQLGPDADQAALTDYVLEAATKYSGTSIFVYHIIALVLFGIWYYFGCGRPKMTNPVKSFRNRCLPVTVILAAGLCLFANAFVLVGQYVMPDVIEAYAEMVEASGLGVDTFAIIASVILAPIGEEILCRGLCFHYADKVVFGMKNRCVAFWIANTLQALMFGIMPFNWVQGTYAFFLGLGLGWLRKHYKSLYPAILAHAIVNFSSTYLVDYPLSLLPENPVSYSILMVFSLALCALAVLIELSSKKHSEDPTMSLG